MPDELQRWDGRKVVGCRSKGAKVFAACDWRDLVLEAAEGIERKARTPSARLQAFDKVDHAALRSRDGRYCDLQSIRSEDTVTWSVFGVGQVEAWVPALLDFAFGRAGRPTSAWRARFWQRLPHPDTGIENHGPEADVTLEADGGWFYAIEAKWLADFSAKQGAAGTTTQLEMRAKSVGNKSPIPDRRGVIVVVPRPSRYPPANEVNSVFGRYFKVVVGSRYEPLPTATAFGAVAVTWEGISQLLQALPHLKTVREYLEWRLALLT